MHKYIKLGREEKLHYLEFGNGKPLVLVPSLWVTSKSYVTLGQELAKYYKVFIPDVFRGNSVFSKEARNIEDYVTKLVQFINSLNLKNYYLIGVSLSGIVVKKYILNYSHKPKRVFLVSTTVLPLNIERQKLTLFWGYLKLLYHNLFSMKGIAIDLMWIIDGLGSAKKHFRQAINEGSIAASLVIDNIKSLPVPTKLLFARYDEFIPLESVKRLLKIKNLEVEIVKEYHGWFFGREEELARRVIKFFK